MGKLFLAGVFLGAAVTFAVIYSLVPRGISQMELEDKLKEAREKERRATADKVGMELRAALGAEGAGIKKEHGAALAERDGKIATLAGEKRELSARLEEAKTEIARLTGKREELEDEVVQLRRKRAGRPAAPKKLLVRRMKLMDARVKLWRTLGEVASVLTQAELGWPDVAGAGKTSKGLPKLVEEHAALSRSVKVFVEENSKELGTELAERDLKSLRVSVRDDYIRAIGDVAEKMRAAISGMKNDSAVVEAKKDGWTDTKVVVERGDIVHVRSHGAWRMIAHWPNAGPDGWDGRAEHRITQGARTGGLIMRIGVSPRISSAYLGKPIVADSAGRVVFRMNDKDVSENGGSVKVQVASAKPASLRAAVGAWKKLTK